MDDEKLVTVPCPACGCGHWNLLQDEVTGDMEATCADDHCGHTTPLIGEGDLGKAQEDGAEWVAGIAGRIADALTAERGVSYGNTAALLRHLAAFVRDSQTSSTAAKVLADAFGIPVEVLNEHEDAEE